MISDKNFKKLSFLVYGLGSTGQSVINFFKKNNIKNYKVWDDNTNDFYKKLRPKNFKKALSQTDYIVLSPGVSLAKSKKVIYLKSINLLLISCYPYRFIIHQSI